MLKIDLNCDMGEGMSSDAAIMPYISSANIACGYHAGDEDTIKRTIALCMEHKVAIGAHPGFADKKNFGRVAVQLSETALYDLFTAQLFIIQKAAAAMGATVHHVKPHGALYNMAATGNVYAKTIAKATKDVDANLIFYGLSNSYMIEAAAALNIKTASEVFADRTYQDDGTLTPRSESNALITDTTVVVKQAMQLITENNVTSVNDKTVFVKADTICLHGDGEYAEVFAKTIFDALQKKHINIETI
ncbi:MAG: LamB/YcsF family protein [Chitinophagaceae bacterium]|nr:LamB/YcsF family protein [Chitinophagaceae bacterium]